MRLLDRNRQGVEPTEYGRALLDGGAAVFDDLRQAVKNIEFLADPRLAKFGSDAARPYRRELRFCRHRSALPALSAHRVSSRGRQTPKPLHQELSERNIDFLIARRVGALADEKLGFEILYDESYVVVAGAQNPWVRRRRIELAELVSESWVLPPPESVLGSVAKEAFRASGLDYPRVTVVTFPREVRMSLVATGRFLTILPGVCIAIFRQAARSSRSCL